MFVKKIKCICFLGLFFFLFGFKNTYALNVITLAPNITQTINQIITKAKKDHLDPKVEIIATVHYQGEPKEISQIASIGDAFHIQTEKLILLKPDMVFIWQGTTPQNVIETLKQFHIKIIQINAKSLNDIPLMIEKIANAINLSKTGKEMALQFQLELKQIKSKIKIKENNKKTVFIQISALPLYGIGGTGFINEMVSFCGGRNIFNSIKKEAFALSTESVMLKNPDIILITKNQSTAYQLFNQSQWQKYPLLNAVKNKQIYTINSQIVSQATPNLIHGVQALCDVLNTSNESK